MDAIRETIAQTLHRLPVEPLPGTTTAAPQNILLKAGILPFLPAASREEWRVCLMKPVAKHADRNAPDFQLAKGTRMHHTNGTWADMKESEPHSPVTETLLETALREGMEEIGLEITRILRIIDIGTHEFVSVSSGRVKYMHLFAAEMPDENCLMPISAVATTTADRAWISLSDLPQQAREDHARMIDAAVQHIVRLYQE